jgi:hypothetical protein
MCVSSNLTAGHLHIQNREINLTMCKKWMKLEAGKDKRSIIPSDTILKLPNKRENILEHGRA